MVDVALVEQNRQAMGELSSLVQDAVGGFVLGLDLGNPDSSRDALLAFMPQLIVQYGDVAESIALDYYDAMRASSGSRGSFIAKAPKRGVTAEVVATRVRYFAKHLWTDSPSGILTPLQGAADKWVKQPGRDVVSWNAQRERARWVRVPAGPKTCSFCLLMASRAADASQTGAVFNSEHTALFTKDGQRYHGGNCQCEAVRLGDGEEYPPHYLPDDHYAMYQAARNEAGSGNLNDILAAMRRLYPDELSDGVHAH